MKDTSSKGLLKIGTGAVGILIVLTMLIAINVIVGTLRARIDLTEEKLYTLSPGSKEILRALDRPVTLKYYFSRSSADAPIFLKDYATQVESLLKEYEVAAKGNLILEVYDPKPDSDEEEWARRYGIEEQQTSMLGPPIYFGIVATAGSSDGEEAIPALSPRKESSLEYDITRLITQVGTASKPVLGLMSSLPVMGGPAPNPMAMMGMPPQQPSAKAWLAFGELERDYEVREIAPSGEAIDDDVDTLILVHPKELADTTLYAIDQFVLRGGRLLAFVDPFSIADAEANPPPNPMMGMPPQGQSSDLPPLFDAWGVAYDPAKVLADTRAITRLGGRGGRPEESAVVLSLGPQNLDREELLTAQLEQVLLPLSGAFADETSAGLTFTPLLQSSEASSLVDAATAQYGMQAYRSQLTPSGTRKCMAVRLSGTFKTAFPDGKPTAADAEQETSTDLTGPAVHLSEGKGTVLLFADADFLLDRFSVQSFQVFGGFQTFQPINDNLALFANAVEQMAGSEALIAIRSRGTGHRPFTYVDKIEMDAARQWRNKEEELNTSLQETRRKIAALESEKQGNQQLFLSPAQKEEIDAFRKEEYRVKQELNDVRKNLNKDIEHLGSWIKVLNIAVIPVLVILFGLIYSLRRRSR